MIRKVAWRNIWRNRTRSLVIIASVVIGLWAGIFIIALSKGMVAQRKEKMINEQLSHIQIHTPGFKEKQKLADFIPSATKILDSLRQMPGIRAVSGRCIINGMLSAPGGGSGVQIIGIDPDAENQLTGLERKVVEGSYFPDKKNRILIGRALAEKLGLHIGSKVVLTFLDTASNILAGAFRISGLISTGDIRIDKVTVYARLNELSRILGTNRPFIHEIALLLENDEELPLYRAQLKERYPGLMVEAWYDLSPELRYLNQMMNVFLYIFMGIIMMALAFGLVNTMLMAVLERSRELGMLMAIGMNKRKLFLMIVSETVMLALTGAVIGMILAFFSILLAGRYGIDLSMVEQGMASFGMSAVLYPSGDISYYPGIALMVVLFSVLAAVYPARKALKLNPSEAIRKI